MANFDRSGMTQAGINLMGKAIGGATIQFTKLVLGDGEMTGEILDLQGVVSPKQNVDVTRIERNDNQCTVGGELLTSAVKQGFWWREIGLYAVDPDLGEILYNYATSSTPDYIVPNDSGTYEEILVAMVAMVGSNTNVNVNIDDSMVHATKKSVDLLSETVYGVNNITSIGVEKRSSNELTGVKRVRRPILSFVSDDLSNNDWEYRDIFINNGVACSVPIVTRHLNEIDDAVNKCKILQDQYGYEFGSHTVNHRNLTTLSTDEIEYELRESKRIIESHGLKCNVFYVPFGQFTSEVLDISKKYYRATRTSVFGLNLPPIPTYRLETRWLDGENPMPIEEAKSYIDECVEKNGWLIFGFHTGAVDRTFMEEKIDVLIKYAKSLGVEVLTVDKALDNIGNPIEIGDHYNILRKSSFVVDCDGKIHSTDLSDRIPFDSTSNIPSAHTPNDIKGIKTTVSSIGTLNATGYPNNKAGTLIAFRPWGAEYTLEFYSELVSKKLHYRQVNQNNFEEFSEWKEINTMSIEDIQKKLMFPFDGTVGKEATHTPDDILASKVTVSEIPKSKATGYPNNKAGTLMAFRSWSKDFIIELYSELDNKKLHYRQVNQSDTTQFSQWKEVATVNYGITNNRPLGVAMGYQYWDTMLQKPIWWSGTEWKDANGTTV